MAIETLWELYLAGGKVHFRCAAGGREGLHSIRECHFRYQPDLMTLMLTRGRACNPADLQFGKMRCPMCGSRHYWLGFTVPGQPSATALRVGW